MRHGESTWNASGLLQGQAEGPVLTAVGRSQAVAAATALRGLPIRTIVTSDLARAQQTAAIIGQRLGCPWTAVAELRERNLGLAEGSLAELRSAWSGVESGRVVDADARPPGGESLTDLSNRVGDYFDRLLHDDNEGDVLVVTHGGVIRVALARRAGIPVSAMTWGHVSNASVWSLDRHDLRQPVLH